jgi:hypothetical protein
MLLISLFMLRSLVIRYLYTKGGAVSPPEAHAELIVDSNAVLAFPVTAERLQPVAGRDSQILQVQGGMEGGQLPPGYASQICRRHSSAFPGVPELLRVLVGKGLDHGLSLMSVVNNVNR